MASVTLYPAAFDTTNSSYNGVASSYPASAVVGKSASNSGYGVGVGLKTGSGAATSAYFSFDMSEVPAEVDITGVSCKVAIYGGAYLTTRTSTRYIRLCKSITTGVGTQTTWTTGSSASSVTPEITSANGGTWTRDELENLRVLVYVTRSSSSTSTSQYVYVRGIDLTIEYEETGVKHTLTIESNGFSVDPSESGEYTEMSEVTVTISESTMPKVTLDGTDITDQFTEQSVDTSYSGAATGSSYTGISSGSSSIANAVGYTAESPSSGTTCWYSSNNATVDSCYAQYTFDLSSIPSNAENITVSCTIAGAAENSTYSHQASSGRYSVWALCCNGTAKSEQIYTTSTSTTTLSFSNTGSWTRTELDGLQLRHYVGYYGGRTNGITLSISYTVSGGGVVYVYNVVMDTDHVLVITEASSGPVLHVKVNGSWKEVTQIYQKHNGSWVAVDANTIFGSYTNGQKINYIPNS